MSTTYKRRHYGKEIFTDKNPSASINNPQTSSAKESFSKYSKKSSNLGPKGLIKLVSYHKYLKI